MFLFVEKIRILFKTDMHEYQIGLKMLSFVQNLDFMPNLKKTNEINLAHEFLCIIISVFETITVG